MGGSAIAGNLGGPGSLYYNPAMITGGYKANFSFNASLGSVDSYRAKNIFGENIEFGDTRVRFKPRFFSLFLRPESNPRLSLELSSFSKDDEVVESNENITTTRNVFTTLTGDEIINGYLGLSTRARESWYGLGASYEVTDKFRVGLTTFILDKNIQNQTTFSYNVFPQEDTTFQGSTPVPFFVSSVDSYSRVKISNFRNMFKVGMVYSGNTISAGMTITTPSWKILGNGESARSIKLSNIPNEEENGFRKDLIIADAQKKLAATLKDPLSVAFGLTFQSPNKRTRVSGNIEYFQQINAYKAIEAAVNPNITNRQVFDALENKDILSRVHGGNQLVNFAVGFQRVTSKGNAIMGGFRTDYDYLRGINYGELDGYAPLKQIVYNVYHVTFGGQFKVLKNSIIAGFRYSFGSDREPYINLVGDEINNVPPGVNNPDQSATFSYSGLSLFAGFTLNFGKDVADYLSDTLNKN